MCEIAPGYCWCVAVQPFTLLYLEPGESRMYAVCSHVFSVLKHDLASFMNFFNQFEFISSLSRKNMIVRANIDICLPMSFSGLPGIFDDSISDVAAGGKPSTWFPPVGLVEQGIVLKQSSKAHKGNTERTTQKIKKFVSLA